MPIAGKIANGHAIGYKDNHKFIWAACESCGKERWVQLVRGAPLRRQCRRCASRSKLDTAEIVRLYCDEKLSVDNVVKRLGGSAGTVVRRLSQLGLMRSRTEAARLKARRGPYSPSWKGGRTTHAGYIKVYRPEHPRAGKDGYVHEHIIVWEEYHNRQLPEGWVIHHINGIKDDNRPRNLLALPKGEHSPTLLLKDVQKRVRELEIENRQLQRALANSQMIFYISEN